MATTTMATTQRAARYYGKEDIRIENNVPITPCEPHQVRIAPAFVGICGTDLHEFLGGPKYVPTLSHLISLVTLPAMAKRPGEQHH